jgi:hypothetical protein
MKFLALFSLLFCTHLAFAQTVPERRLDFTVSADGSGYRFSPIMPPLQQKAGAPAAYWTYRWEFGDGSFSREERPSHTYIRPGNYDVILEAIAHYDDGDRPKSKKKTITADRSYAGTNPPPPFPDVFDEKAKQAVAMSAFGDAKAKETFNLILSYRNLGTFNTDGRLHLFFNEKNFPTRHFQLDTARAYAGEVPDLLLSQATHRELVPADWTLLTQLSSTGANAYLSNDWGTASILEAMLSTARSAYREEKAWKFTSLTPNEKHNVFFDLACTPEMLKDTNALVHLEGIFAPFDPAVAPERFVLEIKIVASHDPNAIAVSDNRINYRSVGNKKLNYKVQFQNNGEGPASTVEVKIEIPEGLDMKRMKPLEWSPKCPICPKTPTKSSCLDTASTKDGLTFTFRNIYLPGSRQEGVEKRDSTKGMIKYRIEADKNMPKRAFKSRAKIVFDKNPPIYTNYTRTRFKIGVSPGIKAGYAFAPDSLKNGYTFIGASLSPFKSWRIYPQVELLTGIKGQTDIGPDGGINVSDTTGLGDAPFSDAPDTFMVKNANIQGKTRFVSFEVPFLLRKNFNRFIGMGLGASARVILNTDDIERRNSIITYARPFTPAGQTIKPDLFIGISESTETEQDKTTRFRYSIFADLTLGSVRVGPNLGIRGGVQLGDKNKRLQPFIQASLEVKL